MLRKFSIALTLGFCVAGVATVAEVRGDSPISVLPTGCPSAVSTTLAFLGFGGALPAPGGQVVFGEAAPCCTSDPCPATGQPVSCCAEGCTAFSDRVWCFTTGWVICPEDNPCKSDGSCNPSCGCSDPDCAACPQNASCSSDGDCDPCNQGFGFCDKEPWEIVGSCSCYF